MPDHTFPATEGCKLVPAGYMPLRLKPRTRQSRSLSPRKRVDFRNLQRRHSSSPQRRLCAHSYFDTSKRERVKWPRTGEVHIALLAARFSKTTSSTHAKNVRDFLKDEMLPCGRRVAIFLTDGGPDWSGKSLLNIYNFGKLWMDLKLDALILIRYAPRHSKYNPIERRWAPLTKKLSQVSHSYYAQKQHKF